MKWLNGNRMRLVVAVRIVAAIVLGGGTAKADFTFGQPTNLGPIINSSADDWPPIISADGLTLYFNSNRSGGYGNHDLWVTRRPTVYDPWGEPVNLGSTVNGPAKEAFPSISADGLSLFFESTRPGGYGNHDLWVTTRPTVSDPWGPPVNLGPTVNTSYQDATPGISADGLSLFFESTRSGYGSFDLWVTTRTTPDADWSAPVNLGATVNSSAWDGLPSISADGRTLFFESKRPGGYGSGDIWVTRRATTEDYWGTPVNLGPTVNTSDYEGPGSISADGSTLYFISDRPGGYGGADLWQVSIEPVVDLNGDGIVDAADVCAIVDHWGTGDPLCDIGPMPWGDGTVDVEDLIVLAEHLFEEVDDSTLIAHWKLDEAEGSIAYDSAAVNDAVLLGGAVWQPAGGMVDGAIQLDGVDDHIVAGPALNPADGAFSITAWIKGGAPGQVIISQEGGVNWLSADSAAGNLMTELRFIGGRVVQPPLSSQAVITDGEWHRVGFVWDGAYRALYVDDTLVAEDSQPGLTDSFGGLYIGCGSDLAAGTFWSGLIDDVRIYNRAMKP
jgi:Tol biopolymer transport system component